MIELIPPVHRRVYKMGMEHIGPFTFSFARTSLGFLVVLPLALIFETKNIYRWPGWDDRA